jgi:ABC-type branched-subunit amino acid transport system substrate-binding protein
MKKIKQYVLEIFGVIAIFLPGSINAEEIGISDTKIVIGQSAAFSGPASQLGQDINLGARTYFQMINDRGGIHGRKIELLTRDDGYEPDRAAQNTREFVEKDKVFALFGYVHPNQQRGAADFLCGEGAFHRSLHRGSVIARTIQSLRV